ncbi:MAG: TonB-dependent receptor [Brevundimonas sp.]|uniref:TonB-dependent receptor domain-containing protein n=1 Tax=Brevundimonas sp. TaxID=1871086 RepID=UPI0030018D62
MSNRTLLMTTALLFGCVLFGAAPALAQDADQDPPATAEDEDAEEATEVDEVVVQATRPDIITAADRMIYNVSNDVQAQTGSVADVLRNVPGVEVDLQGNVSLRGDGNVTILVDGRPSAMLRGASRADVLQAMSGSQIERVEVITNPSAAFSPEGSGGVINLVTRTAQPSVTSVGVRASWDGGERGNLSLSGSRTKDGLTLSGEVGLRHNVSDFESESTRLRPGATPAATITEGSLSTGENTNTFGNARVGADYDLNARDRISGELSYRAFDAENDNTQTFERADGNGIVSDRYQRLQTGGFSNSNVGGRLSWRRKLEGDQHELAADFEVDSSTSERDLDLISTTQVGGEPDFLQRTGSDNQNDSYGFKLDYTRPMGERRLLKIGYEGDLDIDAFNSFGSRGPDEAGLVPIAALTNRFDYEEWVHAAYVTYERPFGDLDVQAGLRVEQVDFQLDQITDSISVQRDYLKAYPTLNFGYQMTDSQRLRGGYSRRISRPSPQDLNPYTVYIDPQNLRRGNPDLEPEITDSFELGWQMRKGQTFYAVTAFYRDSSGGVTDISQDIGGGVVLTTRENLGESQRTGVEFIVNGRFGPKVTYNASGTVFQNDISIPGIAGGIERSGTSGTARASINWSPTETDFFQLNGFYVGEQIQAQSERSSFGMLNIGYRRKFTDSFSMVVTGTNILDTAEITAITDTPDFQDRSRVRFSEPTYYIGLTYTFGSSPRRQEPAFDFGTPGVPQ